MCLYTNGIIRVADKDITCYRILERTPRGLVTPYQEVPVNVEERQIAKPVDSIESIITLSKHPSPIYKINEGVIHSYKTLEGISKGLNVLTCMITAFKVKYEVWKAIIPKGTKFVEGDNVIAYGYGSEVLEYVEMLYLINSGNNEEIPFPST